MHHLRQKLQYQSFNPRFLSILTICLLINIFITIYKQHHNLSLKIAWFFLTNFIQNCIVLIEIFYKLQHWLLAHWFSNYIEICDLVILFEPKWRACQDGDLKIRSVFWPNKKCKKGWRQVWGNVSKRKRLAFSISQAIF